MKLVRFVLVSLCSVLALCGPAATVHAVTLSDSTESNRFALPNGLQVRTRHIPNANGVAITVAYRAGTLYEPAGREGIGDLLAELAYTAPAGDVPERTQAEMNSLRPLGWGVRTNQHLALLTEVATREQFPGALRQVAARMRGVKITDATLKDAVLRTRRDLGARFFGEAGLALYYRSADLAYGASDESIVRRASGKGLDGMNIKEVSALLQRLYVPANGVLTLVGDLSGMDLEKVVLSEFGSIPAGRAAAESAPPKFRPGLRAMPWKGLERAVGVLAVQSPAVTDSLHPSFFLSALITAAGLPKSWGPATPPLTTRFQYSLFDDAELVRFYPPVGPGTVDPQGMGEEFSFRLDELASISVNADQLEQVRSSVAWMLGAPLTPELKRRAQAESGPLSTLGTIMATRALWQGDVFWDDYLARFQSQRYGHSSFYMLMDRPDHQFKLLFTPGK
ncbi:MAG: hypothetical protein ABIU54_12220 [Candidatus Eisenbacteria bacterium]